MKKMISLMMALLISASVSLFSACEYLDGFVNNDPVSSNSQSASSSSSGKTECTAHSFGEWETVKEASCIAGEKQRVCESCDFTETEEIPALNDFLAHSFDENTLCTTCGHQEFIESEEYITVQKGAIDKGEAYPYDLYTWTSADGSYGLQIMSNPNRTFISGYFGTPVEVILPSNINGTSITYIGKQYGMGFSALPFKNCETLESIYIRKNMKIFARSSTSHSFIGCSNLKYVYLEEGAGCFTHSLDEVFPYAEIIYV